jgi:hypothetical protein
MTLIRECNKHNKMWLLWMKFPKNAAKKMQATIFSAWFLHNAHLRRMSPVSRGLERHSGCKVGLVICIQCNIIKKAQHYASIRQLNWNVARNAETHSFNTTPHSGTSQWTLIFASFP